MLNWTITFLVIALIAAVLGFTGIAGAAAGIAKILFVMFLVIFGLSLLFGKRSAADQRYACSARVSTVAGGVLAQFLVYAGAFKLGRCRNVCPPGGGDGRRIGRTCRTFNRTGGVGNCVWLERASPRTSSCLPPEVGA